MIASRFLDNALTFHAARCSDYLFCLSLFGELGLSCLFQTFAVVLTKLAAIFTSCDDNAFLVAIGFLSLYSTMPK